MIDGIRFVLAFLVNGEDLTNASFTWYLQYKNKYGQGESVVLAPTVEDNLVKLTWIPDVLATQVPGRLQIQLYATIVEGGGEAAVVTTRWVSEPALIYVQENLSPDPIIQTELSVFDYYLTMYSSFKEAAEAAAAAALASAQAAENSEDNAELFVGRSLIRCWFFFLLPYCRPSIEPKKAVAFATTSLVEVRGIEPLTF